MVLLVWVYLRFWFGFVDVGRAAAGLCGWYGICCIWVLLVVVGLGFGLTVGGGYCVLLALVVDFVAC